MEINDILIEKGYHQISDNIWVKGRKKVKFFMPNDNGIYQMMAISSMDHSFPKIEYEIPDSNEKFISYIDNDIYHINDDFVVRAKLLSKGAEIYVEVSDRNGHTANVLVKSYRNHFDKIEPQQYFIMRFKLASKFLKNKFIPIIEVTDVIKS